MKQQLGWALWWAAMIGMVVLFAVLAVDAWSLA